jgi:transposase
MNNITSLAIDLAKNVFQLHGTDVKGNAILKKRITRGKLAEFVANLPKCNIYMEACGTANYWGRKFASFGHEVKLINPKYVKPYVKRNKNDMNDAAGIAAAARDPDMRFCHVKTEEQQNVQSMHRIRSLLIQQRTALSNQLRGILAEYGVAIAQGIENLRGYLDAVPENNPDNLNISLIEAILELREHFISIDKRIIFYDNKIKLLSKNSESCKRLETIPGIGKLGSTILDAVLGNGSTFKNGRHFAAFLGLVPKQYSSGNKERLLGISKGGDTYIRTLLIHGARSVIRHSSKKTDKLNLWIQKLVVRSGANKTAVALANKIARMAWAVIYNGTNYIADHKHEVKQVI